MKAQEAKDLTVANIPKATVKNRKKSERELKGVYSQIKSHAKHGHYVMKWDYRDSHDKFHVKERLEENGYDIEIRYPYLIIKW